MKKWLMAAICLLSFMFVSCGENKTSLQAIEDGKNALVNQEYEKAEEYFEAALKEDKNNTTASDFLDLSTNYIHLLDMIKDDDYEDLDEVLSNIEDNKELELIKEDYQIVKKKALKKKEDLKKDKNNSSNKQNSTSSTSKATEENFKNDKTQSTSNKENSNKQETSNKEESKKQSNNNAKISAEEAVEKAEKQWNKDNKDSNLKQVVFNDDPLLDENNEYVIGVCSTNGDYKTVGIYYVNASTGAIRFVKV